MKASVRSTYGTPEVLSVKDVNVPVPRHHEVLIKVHATTVNRSDYHVLTGEPFFMRLATGMLRPTLGITGSDFAGKIVSIGKDVKRFKVGDKVMGFIDMGAQSHAEYLSISENKVTFMPVNVTFEQAAACLEGPFYAISALQRIKPRAGQTALVVGATGAIGSSFVQFLKFYGLTITAVCGGENGELVKSLGASHIIDYKTEDFTRMREQFDFVLDGVGKNTFRQCEHLLNARGIFSSSQPDIFNSIISSWKRDGKKEIFPIPKDLMANLDFIRDLVEKEKFIPVIDRKYPLEKIADAYRYVASGQKIGNVIISMQS
jgi:NADPH:quinone reductase-like Zn-dependent oxidoreductase